MEKLGAKRMKVYKNEYLFGTLNTREDHLPEFYRKSAGAIKEV
jgi:hypothetical protein